MIRTTRTRKAHRKSRLGCFACKRRKAKCDEQKPSCTRCGSTLQKCIYPSWPAVLPGFKPSSDISYPLRSKPYDVISSPLLDYPSSSRDSPSRSIAKSNPSTPPAIEARCSYSPNPTEAALRLSDTDLYHHYLEHTSRTFSQCETDQGPLQIGIPTLALQSKPVFYSVLALSTICICCDMISQATPPSLNAINSVLMTGYRHYNLASEHMRELMSQSEPDASTEESLLASALLLVPFCSGSQLVNHWISTLNAKQELDYRKPLSITPRGIIIMMRGIKTTLQTLDHHNSNTFKPTIASPLSDCSRELSRSPVSRRHAMFEVVAATSQRALSKLRERLESLASNDLLSACDATFDVLLTIRADTFESYSVRSPSLETTSVPFVPVRSWLRSYAERHASWRPIEPLTMRFLGFLAEAPQAYIDFILPLLDQRLESPIETSHEISWMCLTKLQALALDIYAHWSIFMLLVEEESWWIGRLPTVTLTGMLNRYGSSFVTDLWPENGGAEEWWPGSMLNILREIKRYQ